MSNWYFFLKWTRHEWLKYTKTNRKNTLTNSWDDKHFQYLEFILQDHHILFDIWCIDAAYISSLIWEGCIMHMNLTYISPCQLTHQTERRTTDRTAYTRLEFRWISRTITEMILRSRFAMSFLFCNILLISW